VYFVVARETWKWSAFKAAAVTMLFLSFDLPFFGANLLKFFDGGYIPLLVASALAVMMVIWNVGRSVLAEDLAKRAMPLDTFLRTLPELCAVRVPGTAVFMTSQPTSAPAVLVGHARRIGALREQIVLMTVLTEHVPFVDEDERLTVERLEPGFWRVVARTGFMEQPSVPKLLERAKAEQGLGVSLDDLTFFLGRETFVAGKDGKMGPVTEGIFAYLARNAKAASAYFGIPHERVVELGIQIDL
jgi:KUP system potassium uptake protein